MGLTFNLLRTCERWVSMVLTLKHSRMVQQEKMASLGEMAAGATHEINNPLNFIQAGAFSVRKKLALLRRSLPPDGSLQEMEARLDNLIDLGEVIGDGCRRIEAIVEGLWAITVQRRGEPESVDLNDGLETPARFVSSTIEDGVELVQFPGRMLYAMRRSMFMTSIP